MVNEGKLYDLRLLIVNELTKRFPGLIIYTYQSQPWKDHPKRFDVDCNYNDVLYKNVCQFVYSYFGAGWVIERSDVLPF